MQNGYDLKLYFRQHQAGSSSQKSLFEVHVSSKQEAVALASSTHTVGKTVFCLNITKKPRKGSQPQDSNATFNNQPVEEAPTPTRCANFKSPMPISDNREKSHCTVQPRNSQFEENYDERSHVSGLHRYQTDFDTSIVSNPKNKVDSFRTSTYKGEHSFERQESIISQHEHSIASQHHYQNPFNPKYQNQESQLLAQNSIKHITEPLSKENSNGMRTGLDGQMKPHVRESKIGLSNNKPVPNHFAPAQMDKHSSVLPASVPTPQAVHTANMKNITQTSVGFQKKAQQVKALDKMKGPQNQAFNQKMPNNLVPVLESSAPIGKFLSPETDYLQSDGWPLSQRPRSEHQGIEAQNTRWNHLEFSHLQPRIQSHQRGPVEGNNPYCQQEARQAGGWPTKESMPSQHQIMRAESGSSNQACPYQLNEKPPAIGISSTQATAFDQSTRKNDGCSIALNYENYNTALQISYGTADQLSPEKIKRIYTMAQKLKKKSYHMFERESLEYQQKELGAFSNIPELHPIGKFIAEHRHNPVDSAAGASDVRVAACGTTQFVCLDYGLRDFGGNFIQKEFNPWQGVSNKAEEILIGAVSRARLSTSEASSSLDSKLSTFWQAQEDVSNLQKKFRRWRMNLQSRNLAHSSGETSDRNFKKNSIEEKDTRAEERPSKGMITSSSLLRVSSTKERYEASNLLNNPKPIGNEGSFFKE